MYECKYLVSKSCFSVGEEKLRGAELVIVLEETML